jgi:preprotein translocase subunit SecG
MVSKLFEADAARRSSGERVERTLLVLAALFIGLYAVLLTFVPGVRSRGAGDDLNSLHWIGYLVWVLGFTLAHRVSVRLIPVRDPYLLPLTAILSGWGLMTIWRLFPDFGTRQTIWIAIAFCVLILGMRLSSDLEFLRR